MASITIRDVPKSTRAELAARGWRPLLEAVPRGVIAPVEPLQAWATCITSAIAHRMRLSSDDIRILAAPFRQDLPLLERRLNDAP